MTNNQPLFAKYDKQMPIKLQTSEVKIMTQLKFFANSSLTSVCDDANAFLANNADKIDKVDTQLIVNSDRNFYILKLTYRVDK